MAGVKKEIGEQSLQGVAWGRKTGVWGGGEGGCRLCVDATHWPTCKINYLVTQNVSVTCQLCYETNEIRLNASASITFACT